MNRDFLCALSRGSDSSCGLKSQVGKDNEAGPSVDAREKKSVCQGARGVLVAEKRTQGPASQIRAIYIPHES